MDLQKRINRSVRNAADQLEPYHDLGIPLLVVLDNWRQVGLPITTVELIQLFGMLEVQGHFSPSDGRVGNLAWSHADDDHSPLGEGRMNHVSAVLVNIPEYRSDDDDFSIERPMHVQIIHNPFAPVQLPLWVFGTQRDVQIVRRQDGWHEFNGTGE